jgi:hypothetical protein
MLCGDVGDVGDVGDMIALESDIAEGLEAIVSSVGAIIMLRQKENRISPTATSTLSILSTLFGP